MVADLNHDGKADVVVANTGDFGDDSTLTVFHGLGNGRFILHDTLRVGKGPAGLASGDLNGDGELDLVVANRGNEFNPDSTISILLNTGMGTFQPAITLVAGMAPNKIAIGRMDDDTLPDIVVANSPNAVHVLLNTGGGFFIPQ